MEKSRRHRSCNMDNSHSEQPELLPTFSVRHRLTHHRIAVAGCSKRLMLMLLLLLFKHTSGVTTVTGRTPRTFRSLPSREGALSVAGNFRFDLNDDDGGLDARGVAGSGTLDEDGEGHPLRMEEYVVVLRPYVLSRAPQSWLHPPARRTQRFAFTKNGEVWTVRQRRMGTCETDASAAFQGEKGEDNEKAKTLNCATQSVNLNGPRNREQRRKRKGSRRTCHKGRGERIEKVGKWWFDKCGLRWDVETKK